MSLEFSSYVYVASGARRSPAGVRPCRQPAAPAGCSVFRVSRRAVAMARSQLLAGRVGLTLLACGCGVVDGDEDIVDVVVFPQQVALTPDQTQLFIAYGHTSAGDSIPAEVGWSTSGGSVDSDGMYTPPSTPGDYVVVATHTQRSWLLDTAWVEVSLEDVPVVTTVEVTPTSVTLRPGGTQQFQVVARDQSGNVTAGTFSWSASGGSVTPEGSYVAGSQEGDYQVVALEASGVADTAAVTIASVDPVVTMVEVTPASATLRPGGVRQFDAVARDQFGNLTSGTFSWSASGGSVTSEGLYTAGSQTGSHEVVATESSGVADTASVTIAEVTAGYLNEPAGLVVLGEHSFPAGYFGDDEHFAAAATHTAPGTYWLMRDYEKRLHIETDIADAPMSPPGTMGMAYPAGMPSSGEPASFGFYIPEQRELYVSYHFLMPSNPNNGMWELEPAGVKILGYISYGSIDRQNEGPLGFKPGGLQPGPLSIASNEYLGKPSSCATYVNEAERYKITLDEWHQLEIYGKLNDMGVANGIHRMWLDGELYTDCTEMSYITPAEPHGFWQVHFQPVWGGWHEGLTKSQDDYAYLDHIYVSGINK